MLPIGVDLGGTRIEIIALDEEGREVFRRRATRTTGAVCGATKNAWHARGGVAVV